MLGLVCTSGRLGCLGVVLFVLFCIRVIRVLLPFGFLANALAGSVVLGYYLGLCGVCPPHFQYVTVAGGLFRTVAIRLLCR